MLYQAFITSSSVENTTGKVSLNEFLRMVFPSHSITQTIFDCIEGNRLLLWRQSCALNYTNIFTEIAII